MKVYKEGEAQIEVGGIVYTADENGVIDIPDGKVTSKVWERGFHLADGHLAELARNQAAEASLLPVKAESGDGVKEAPDKSKKA